MSKKKNEIETNALRYCWQQTVQCHILVELVSGEKRKYLNGRKVHDIRYECESKRNVCKRGSKSKEETGGGKWASLKWSKVGSILKMRPTILCTSNIPSYFEETGVVSKGSAKHVQCMVVTTPGLVIS